MHKLYLLITLVMVALPVKAEPLKNPFFYREFYNENTRDEIIYVSEEGLKNQYHMTNWDCDLKEDTGSKLSFSCYTKSFGDYFCNIDVYSIGKNEKGFCQAFVTIRSLKDDAVGSWVMSSEYEDCGPTEPKPEVKHIWHNKPEKPFTEFKNPKFNRTLRSLTHANDYIKLFMDKIEFYWLGRLDSTSYCVLILNTDVEVGFECEGGYDGVDSKPTKEYRFFVTQGEDWDWVDYYTYYDKDKKHSSSIFRYMIMDSKESYLTYRKLVGS